jgi:hypothetical protein
LNSLMDMAQGKNDKATLYRDSVSSVDSWEGFQ